jgi:hypothetical protein
MLQGETGGKVKDPICHSLLSFAVTASLVLCASCVGADGPRLTYADLVGRLTDLERLAVLPAVGEKGAQASSFDRQARYDVETCKYIDWDANVDNGSTITKKEGEKIVFVEIEGPGCVWRAWSGNPVEGHFQFFFDGAEKPTLDMPFRQFFDGSSPIWPPLSEKSFSYPPEKFTEPFGAEPLGVRGRANGTALYHCASSGWNSYVPMPFQKSLKVLADPWIPPYNHDGWGMFFQFTYAQYPKGTQLPTFVSLDDRKALDQANKILSRCGVDPAGKRPGQKTVARIVKAEARGATSVLDLPGSGAITALKVKIPLPPSPADRDLLRKLVLRITWDDDSEPSVWSPLGDFFGTAPGFNKYRSLPLGMTDDGFYSFWYMPFASRAHIEIVNDDEQGHTLEFSITHAPLSRPIEELGRFHAKWHRDAFLDAARPIDWTLLKTSGRGRYCGTTLHVWSPKGEWWGEGDEKFFVDGEKFPSTFGTGTEDYFGYAWADPYIFTNCYHNQTIYNRKGGHSSQNRWHIGDNVPFQTSFEASIEKYYANDVPDLWDGVVYWYLSPGGTDPYMPVPLKDRIGYYARPTSE